MGMGRGRVQEGRFKEVAPSPKLEKVTLEQNPSITETPRHGPRDTRAALYTPLNGRLVDWAEVVQTRDVERKHYVGATSMDESKPGWSPFVQDQMERPKHHGSPHVPVLACLFDLHPYHRES